MAKRSKLKKNLAKAVASQAKYYNAKHLSQLYNIEDFVYLNSKNIELTRSIKKLDWKYYGPYKMIDKIGKVAYKLDLSKSIKIHNRFHVSLLKMCNKSKEGSIPLQPLIEINGEEKFEVKKILNSRIRYHKLQYLIK